MVTILGIILADVLVLLLYIYFYRQELGLTVAGSSDAPVLRKTRASQSKKSGPKDTTTGQSVAKS